MKRTRIILLVLAALALLSPVSAGLFDIGMNSFENFFSGGWLNYDKTITFVVFFFLFFTAFLIGLKNAMKEITRPHTAFAFFAALLASFIITTTYAIDLTILKWIAWGLLALLLFYILYALLSKTVLKDKPFWAFLLALLLTALILGLIWYLAQQGRPLEGFKIANPFANWKMPSISQGKTPKKTPLDRPPITGKETKPGTTPGETPGKSMLAKYWWILPLIPLIVGGGIYGVSRARGRRRGQADRGGGETPGREDDPRINFLNHVLSRKQMVLKNMAGIEEQKQKIDDKLPTIKAELAKIKGKDITYFMDNIAPYLRSPKSEEYKKRRLEARGIDKLIIDNHIMMRLFRVLFKTEQSVISAVSQFRSDNAEMMQRWARLEEISSQIIILLRDLFNIGSRQRITEENLKELLSDRNIENRVSEKWIKTAEAQEDTHSQLLKQELDNFAKVKPLLEQEIAILTQLIGEHRRQPALISISITNPKPGQRFDPGAEIPLKAEVSGININNPQYTLRWFMRDSENYEENTDPKKETLKMSNNGRAQKIAELQIALRAAQGTTNTKLFRQTQERELALLQKGNNDPIAMGTKVTAMVPADFKIGKAYIYAKAYRIYVENGMYKYKEIAMSGMLEVNIGEVEPEIKPKVTITSPHEGREHNTFTLGQEVEFDAECPGAKDLPGGAMVPGWRWKVDGEVKWDRKKFVLKTADYSEKVYKITVEAYCGEQVGWVSSTERKIKIKGKTAEAPVIEGIIVEPAQALQKNGGVPVGQPVKVAAKITGGDLPSEYESWIEVAGENKGKLAEGKLHSGTTYPTEVLIDNKPFTTEGVYNIKFKIRNNKKNVVEAEATILIKPAEKESAELEELRKQIQKLIESMDKDVSEELGELIRKILHSELDRLAQVVKNYKKDEIKEMIEKILEIIEAIKQADNKDGKKRGLIALYDSIVALSKQVDSIKDIIKVIAEINKGIKKILSEDEERDDRGGGRGRGGSGGGVNSRIRVGDIIINGGGGGSGTVDLAGYSFTITKEGKSPRKVQEGKEYADFVFKIENKGRLDDSYKLGAIIYKGQYAKDNIDDSWGKVDIYLIDPKHRKERMDDRVDLHNNDERDIRLSLKVPDSAEGKYYLRLVGRSDGAWRHKVRKTAEDKIILEIGKDDKDDEDRGKKEYENKKSPLSKLVFPNNPAGLIGFAFSHHEDTKYITLDRLEAHYQKAKKNKESVESSHQQLANEIRLDAISFPKGRYDIPVKGEFEGKAFARDRFRDNPYVNNKMNIPEVFSQIDALYRDINSKWSDFDKVVRESAKITEKKGASIGVFDNGQWDGINPKNAIELVMWVNNRLDPKKRYKLEDDQKGVLRQFAYLTEILSLDWDTFELGVWEIDRLIEKIYKKKK